MLKYQKSNRRIHVSKLNEIKPELFIQISLTNDRNYHKVGVVEAVDDVPTQLLKLFTLEEDRVEEYEGEQKLLVLGLCLAELELVLGHQAVKPFHVCL